MLLHRVVRCRLRPSPRPASPSYDDLYPDYHSHCHYHPYTLALTYGVSFTLPGPRYADEDHHTHPYSHPHVHALSLAYRDEYPLRVADGYSFSHTAPNHDTYCNWYPGSIGDAHPQRHPSRNQHIHQAAR